MEGASQLIEDLRAQVASLSLELLTVKSENLKLRAQAVIHPPSVANLPPQSPSAATPVSDIATPPHTPPHAAAAAESAALIAKAKELEEMRSRVRLLELDNRELRAQVKQSALKQVISDFGTSLHSENSSAYSTPTRVTHSHTRSPTASYLIVHDHNNVRSETDAPSIVTTPTRDDPTTDKIHEVVETTASTSTSLLTLSPSSTIAYGHDRNKTQLAAMVADEKVQNLRDFIQQLRVECKELRSKIPSRSAPSPDIVIDSENTAASGNVTEVPPTSLSLVNGPIITPASQSRLLKFDLNVKSGVKRSGPTSITKDMPSHRGSESGGNSNNHVSPTTTPTTAAALARKEAAAASAKKEAALRRRPSIMRLFGTPPRDKENNQNSKK